MAACLGKSCFFFYLKYLLLLVSISVAVQSVYCACLWGIFSNLCVLASFLFGFEGVIWDLIVLVPDHWPSF